MTQFLKFRRGGVTIAFETPLLTYSGNAFIPTTAVIPLDQHSGEAAHSIVSVGDRVREGQLIARGPVPVHASIPGIVSAFRSVPLPDGRMGEAIVIDLCGSFDITGRKTAHNGWKNIPTADITRLIEERGVVNCFEKPHPLAVDLKIARSGTNPTLVCRLFDQDPTSPIETRLFSEKSESVLAGFALIAHAMRASSVIIVVSEDTDRNEPYAQERAVAFGDLPVTVLRIKSRYPCGSKKRLERFLSSKIANFAQGYALYCDPVTSLAAHDAIVHDIPPISTHVMVQGSAIAHPQFLQVKTGTLIGDVIDECGGFKMPPARIIVNGLLGGTALYDLDTPITRYTHSLHIMDRDVCPPFSVLDCIHCGACLASCPAGLDPARTVSAIRNLALSPRTIASIAACEGCGCCTMVCPSRIPLHHEIAGGNRLVSGDGNHE